MTSKTSGFAVGDRVTWVTSPGGTQQHGVVVYYHRSRHNAKEPRVRWNDGWGYHVKAKDLRLLTAQEARQWPHPRQFDCDVKTPYPFPF